MLSASIDGKRVELSKALGINKKAPIEVHRAMRGNKAVFKTEQGTVEFELTGTSIQDTKVQT